MDPLIVQNWLLCAAIASPHVLYAFIWFNPDKWMAIFKKQSVQVFENVAWMIKLLQFAASAIWFLQRRPEGIDFMAIPPAHLALGLTLGIIGQILNISIYRAIGHAGVYYGFKLGHKIPWVNGFPFNVVSHPQYVGSILSIWGMTSLLWAQAPAGLGLVACYWTALYVITGIKEDCF